MSSTHRVRLFPVSCSLCSSAYRNYLFVQSSFPTDYESKRRSSEGDALKPGGVCRWCQVRIMSARNPTNTSNGLESADEVSEKLPELHNMLEKFSQSFIKYSLSVSKSLQPTPCHGEEDYEVIHYERSPPPSPTSSTFPSIFEKLLPKCGGELLEWKTKAADKQSVPDSLLCLRSWFYKSVPVPS